MLHHQPKPNPNPNPNPNRAYGALLFEMLQGRVAFDGSSLDSLYMAIRNVKHPPFAKGVSKAAQAVIRGLLVAAASKRLTAENATVEHSGWLGC